MLIQKLFPNSSKLSTHESCMLMIFSSLQPHRSWRWKGRGQTWLRKHQKEQIYGSLFFTMWLELYIVLLESNFICFGENRSNFIFLSETYSWLLIGHCLTLLPEVQKYAQTGEAIFVEKNLVTVVRSRCFQVLLHKMYETSWLEHFSRSFGLFSAPTKRLIYGHPIPVAFENYF